jgi:hypothetical protein
MHNYKVMKRRILLQNKGISATHPIIILERENDFVVCSVASWEGDSNFDYSLILKKSNIFIDMNQEELLSQICRTDNYIESSWGFSLALANGLTQDELTELSHLIDIDTKSRIRLSKATKKRAVSNE